MNGRPVERAAAVSSNDSGEYDRLIDENLVKQNELEYQLSDTLDIKTSIALVVIAFLATQSAGFLASNMPRHWHIVQVLSVILLILAGVLAVWELIPRKYTAGLAPDKFRGWANGVKEFYAKDGLDNPEGRAADFIRRKRQEQLAERFAHNSAINAKKSRAVTVCFYCTMAALIANLATLAALATGWRF